jgi:hypothetical protein
MPKLPKDNDNDPDVYVAEEDMPSEVDTIDETTDVSAAESKPKAPAKKKEPAFTRPKALYFVGNEAGEHLAGYGLDARDYTEGDPALDRLTDEQVHLALDSKLYRRTKPS